MNKQDIWIVIPAMNEVNKIGEVIRLVLQQGYQNIMVIDDGSQDGTGRVAQKAGARVLRHMINRGAGAATYTGIQAVLKLGANVIVTLDADGQHRPDDLEKLIKPILEKKTEVVLGSRLLEKQKMPLLRKIFNLMGNVVTWLLFGLWVSDSQSGFKAFSRRAVEQIKIQTNGYEFCSEVIREIRLHKLKFIEVPIQTHYSEYSLQKGQNFTNGVKTFWKLILRKLMG